jgi:hypothetical protein
MIEDFGSSSVEALDELGMQLRKVKTQFTALSYR